MFTGIIEEVGTVVRADARNGGKEFQIRAAKTAKGLRVNDSVAVNGVCLTVTKKKPGVFHLTAVEETLLKSNLGSLTKGSRVNLELPLRLNERLGGHIVLGHADATGAVAAVGKLEGSILYTIAIAKEFSKYIIPVGSVAVDGVSLTVAKVTEEGFVVSIIPHTLKKTILGSYDAGTRVNLEFDMVGKYIERMAFAKPFPSEEELRGQGF